MQRWKVASRSRARQQFWTSSNWISAFRVFPPTMFSYLRRCREWRSNGDFVSHFALLYFFRSFFSSPPVDCRVMMEQERLTNNKKEGDRDHYFIFCQCVTECKAELFLCGLEWCLMEASSAFACRGFRSERWSGESFGSWPSRCLAVTLNKKYDDGFISIFQLFSRTALFRAQIPPCCLLHRERALLTMIKCFSFCLLIL